MFRRKKKQNKKRRRSSRVCRNGNSNVGRLPPKPDVLTVPWRAFLFMSLCFEKDIPPPPPVTKNKKLRRSFRVRRNGNSNVGRLLPKIMFLFASFKFRCFPYTRHRNSLSKKKMFPNSWHFLLFAKQKKYNWTRRFAS